MGDPRFREQARRFLEYRRKNPPARDRDDLEPVDAAFRRTEEGAREDSPLNRAPKRTSSRGLTMRRLTPWTLK